MNMETIDNDLKKIGQGAWDEAYTRGGNITFYPNEEVVRFLNRYVKKRRGIAEFENILDIDEKSSKSFKALDLGCGIGRHIKLLDEFQIESYGIDLSQTAIDYGKKWFDSMGKGYVSERLQVGSVAQLPFEDAFFDICVSESVLDSMPREIARKGVVETHRTLKENGLFFLSLIMDSQKVDEDVIVEEGFEKDTVQSYFTEAGIESFLKDYFDIVDLKIISTEDVFRKGYSVRRLEENLFIKKSDDTLVTTSKRAYIVAKRK